MSSIPVRHIANAQKEPVLAEGFSIREVKELLGGKDMVQELHRHDFFYVLALKKGKGGHHIDFTAYEISDHVVFFMRPGQVHQLVLKAGGTGYLIQFRNSFYSSRQLLRCLNHYLLNTKLISLLAYILQEYQNKQPNYQEVIKAQMSVFFIELLRQHPTVDNARLYIQEQLETFFELLDTHIVNHKQVSAYADMLHLSAYQLNAITKAALGKTCSALINEHIILEAKKYLLATADQVSQIADQLGYEDVSYFIRFFKKHTGHSPEAFRHNFR